MSNKLPCPQARQIGRRARVVEHSSRPLNAGGDIVARLTSGETPAVNRSCRLDENRRLQSCLSSTVRRGASGYHHQLGTARRTGFSYKLVSLMASVTLA